MLFNGEVDRSCVLLVVYHLGIVVFNTDIPKPINTVILIARVLHSLLFYLYLLLPSFLIYLVPHFHLYVELAVFYFLMDMPLPIMTHHIHIQLIIAILVPQPAFCKILFFCIFMIVEPISRAVISCH